PGDRVRQPDRVLLAVPAQRIPALAHRLRLLCALLWNLSRCCTRVGPAWAAAGYAGKLATWAASLTISAGDRPQARRTRLRGAAPPLGRRAHPSLDHRSPPLRPATTNGCPKATRSWSCGP